MSSKSNTQAMETEKIPRLLAQLAIPAVVAQPENENKTDHKSAQDFRHGEWGLCSICGFRQQ